MTKLVHHKQDMATTLLADFSSMSQDAVGNRVSLTASVPSTTAYSGTTSYTYSSKDQLTQEAQWLNSSRRKLVALYVAFDTNNNGFDAVGNPTTFKGTSQSFNSVNQNTLGSTITFDGNGNPGSWNSNSLSWNYNDKLTAIGSTLTAGYSASGLRAWKQNSSSVRAYFLYDGLIPVCELDGSGNVTAYNTVGANGLLARHVNGTGGGSVFYCFDPQGSVSVRVDTSGSVLSTHCNEAWGTQVSSGSGYSSDPYAEYGGQWGYYRDSETGLHLLGHRYYDIASGRFLNRDPAGYGGGINLYAYCGNNALIRQDSSGFAHVIISDNIGGGGGESSNELVGCEIAENADHLIDYVSREIEEGIGNLFRGGGQQPPAQTWPSGNIISNPPAVQPGEPVFSGHGTWVELCGTTNVPEGTTINFYCPHGSGLPDSLGGLIESGQPLPPGTFCEQFGPGADIPNYILHPPDGLNIFGNPTTVSEPTCISDLLQPNMGQSHWAACRRYGYR